MEKMTFEVTLKSDVVLPATANSEGNVARLDFIPGSNFLGMAAAKYNDFSDSFGIFHGAKVRFGDAHLLCGGKRSWKMPLSYFQEKSDETKLRNQAVETLDALTQPKQLRTGYITTEGKRVHPDYNYAQKSAYDAKQRRSKEGQMYGYEAFRAGSIWRFDLTLSPDLEAADRALLLETLEGTKRLGKSKSAEYGEVEIVRIDKSSETPEASTAPEHTTIVYAASRLALVDRNGLDTFDPIALHPDLEEAHIDRERTQIRTERFSPYNGVRRRKDSERLCIAKGSVIVLKDAPAAVLEALKKGVGRHLSEGFGEVLLNPPFLTAPLSKLEEAKADSAAQVQQSGASDETLLAFLKKRETEQKARLALAGAVSAFINEHKDKYGEKMNSQWGTLRSLCAVHTDESIVDAVKAYISKGVAKEKWTGSKGRALIEALKRSPQKVAFLKLLAMRMPRAKSAKGDK